MASPSSSLPSSWTATLERDININIEVLKIATASNKSNTNGYRIYKNFRNKKTFVNFADLECCEIFFHEI